MSFIPGRWATRTITFSCGHEGEHGVMYSRAPERERSFAWASANKSCANCFAAKTSAARSAAFASAQEQSDSTMLLPLLAESATGLRRSAAQVEFATVVRSAVMTAVRNNYRTALDVLCLERDEVTDMNAKTIAFILELFLDVAALELDPKWWLDGFAKDYKSTDAALWDRIKDAIATKGWSQPKWYDACLAKYPELEAVQARARDGSDCSEAIPPAYQQAKATLSRVFRGGVA